MSVVGFDVGNESCVVAVAREVGINAVLNDDSKRKTPAVVCYGKKQRFLGTASMMDPIYTMSQIKRFIGRKFSDAELQKDIKSLPFSVTEGPDGYPLIHAQYLGKNRTFTPTQLLGMVLSDLKIIAEKNLNADAVDCCIAIPVYFTDLQRRAVIDAATIAGLNPLHLIHETTATALAYGIYKTDLVENESTNVAFVDVGHASMQVCIAAFKKGQLKILAHSYDQCLGGRDFDEVLIQHFAAKFKDEYKIDFYQNASACLRLRAACEKLKKVLSVNAEASLNIQCFMDEKDVIGFITRDEFEQISGPILERVRKPLETALACARLTTQDIHSVEVVGLGSRVPMVTKILTEFFGKEPRRTMDASKCVAEGSALQCAILSPTLQVQDFQVMDPELWANWEACCESTDFSRVSSSSMQYGAPSQPDITSPRMAIDCKAEGFLKEFNLPAHVQIAGFNLFKNDPTVTQLVGIGGVRKRKRVFYMTLAAATVEQMQFDQSTSVKALDLVSNCATEAEAFMRCHFIADRREYILTRLSELYPDSN